MTEFVVYDHAKYQALVKVNTAEATHLNKQIIDLFQATFTESENAEEGKSVAHLAQELLNMIEGGNCIAFLAYENKRLMGSVIFSKIFTDACHALLLSPMVVSTEFHGQGIGQALIQYALGYLKNEYVEIVLTYGDPAFYSKLGFESISDRDIIPPYQLSMSIGWLGRSLTETDIQNFHFQVSCVQPFSHPELW